MEALTTYIEINNDQKKKTRWSEIEDYLIFKLYKLHNTKWRLISLYIKSRTRHEVKNRFYSILRSYAYKDCPDVVISKKILNKEYLFTYFNIAYQEKTMKIDEEIEKMNVNVRTLIVNYTCLQDYLERSLWNQKEKQIKYKFKVTNLRNDVKQSLIFLVRKEKKLK